MPLSKQEHVVYGSDSSIVCVSAGATPLHMSAAAEGIDMGGATHPQHQPHTSGESQPVSTALSALRRAAASSSRTPGNESNIGEDRARFADRPESRRERGEHASPAIGAREDLAATAADDFAASNYEEIAVPEVKAKLIKALAARIGVDPSKPHILIIILGGTICMDYAYRNTCLRPARLARKLTRCPELGGQSLPHFDILEWESLVDSSDMGKDQYCTLARQIEAYYREYDG